MVGVEVEVGVGVGVVVGAGVVVGVGVGVEVMNLASRTKRVNGESVRYPPAVWDQVSRRLSGDRFQEGEKMGWYFLAGVVTGYVLFMLTSGLVCWVADRWR